MTIDAEFIFRQFFGMVQICISKEVYYPGDEIKITVHPSPADDIQLLSLRCYGYLRLPSSVADTLPNRSHFAFRDRPIGPMIPDDSMLLWWSPNFPVHIDLDNRVRSLVKCFVPYFLPPSMKGSLFEICHSLDVSVLRKGHVEMLHKRISLIISSESVEMPKLIRPAIGDGFEQFDYLVSPIMQAHTPHGKRCIAWDCLDEILTVATPGLGTRTYRIAFNGLHATEVVVNGNWDEPTECLIVNSGEYLQICFSFSQVLIFLRRIFARIVRTEHISVPNDETPQTCESIIAETVPLTITPQTVESNLQIFFPRLLCPSFQTELCGISYRVELSFEPVQQLLESVTWSLPVQIQQSALSQTEPSQPCFPFGSRPSLIPMETDNFFFEQDPLSAEIEHVIADSSIKATRYTIYPPR